jgi:ribosomal protein L5
MVLGLHMACFGQGGGRATLRRRERRQARVRPRPGSPLDTGRGASSHCPAPLAPTPTTATTHAARIPVPQVEKWQLLLHALGLEMVTGTPATFSQPSSRYYQQRNAVTGVHVTLSGAAAHDALEKIVYLLLPSQNAFDGLLTRQLDRAGNLHFKVSSMVNLPDYEEMFETFENLGALDVNLTLSGVARRPGRSRVLLTGLQVPLLERKHQIESSSSGGGGGGGMA